MQGVKGAKDKSEVIIMRCTPEEKRMLKKLAALAGVSLSGYILGSSLGDKLGETIMEQTKK